jgi:hypothetical protein
MIDLADEFSAAVCSMTPQRIDMLRGVGLCDAAIFHEPLLAGMAPIQTHSGGLYDVDDTASDWAILLPCGEWDGLNWWLDDICAFFPAQPARWWRRRGIADVLGTLPYHFSIQPRRLHAQPLGWINDLGLGLCILDWGSDPLDLLLSAGPLKVDRSIQNKLRTVAIKAATARVRNICHG